MGPAVVNRALARGHEVTLFNRGITRPYLFPKVEKLRGNRSSTNSNLSALGKRRRWDAVIDTWPEHAHLVAETASLLAQRTDYYYFVSSIAVYRDFSEPGLREAAAIRANESGYGGEKFAAEQAVLDILVALGEEVGLEPLDVLDRLRVLVDDNVVHHLVSRQVQGPQVLRHMWPVVPLLHMGVGGKAGGVRDGGADGRDAPRRTRRGT